MSHAVSRRDFLASTSAAAITIAAGSHAEASLTTAGNRAATRARAAAQNGYRGTLCFFSKPLPWMAWGDLASAVKQVGFGGLDLTVRPEGHVLPQNVASDLPRAHAAIRAAGVALPMITTALTSAADPAARSILATASRLGIEYLKPGYYQFRYVDVRRELAEAGREFQGLAALAASHQVVIGYHNHEQYIGAAVWDMARYIEPLDARWVGYYFDPRHATAEGGAGSWKAVTALVGPRLKMMAVKDFYWAKTPRGWEPVNCPLGQGMVDWNYVLSSAASSGFQGPISLHMEYEIAGATNGARQENTLRAAERDLEFLRSALAKAYGSGA